MLVVIGVDSNYNTSTTVFPNIKHQFDPVRNTCNATNVVLAMNIIICPTHTHTHSRNKQVLITSYSKYSVIIYVLSFRYALIYPVFPFKRVVPRGRKLLYQVSKRVVVEAYYNKQIVSPNIQPPTLLHFLSFIVK